MRNKGKVNKNGWLTVIIAIVAFSMLGLGGFSRLPVSTQTQTTTDPNQANPVVANRTVTTPKTIPEIPCIDPTLPVPNELHWHPHLRIVANGKNVIIPANIGLGDSSCERALHTHDTTGELHIEPNAPHTFTLGNFFSVWGEPFSESQVLNYKADPAHEIVMTVDGKPNSEFAGLVLKDRQDIVIEYKKI